MKINPKVMPTDNQVDALVRAESVNDYGDQACSQKKRASLYIEQFSDTASFLTSITSTTLRLNCPALIVLAPRKEGRIVYIRKIFCLTVTQGKAFDCVLCRITVGVHPVQPSRTRKTRLMTATMPLRLSTTRSSWQLHQTRELIERALLSLLTLTAINV